MDGEIRHQSTEHVPVSNFREIIFRLCDELDTRALLISQEYDEQPTRKIVSRFTTPLDNGQRMVAYESRPKSLIDPEGQSWHHTVRVVELDLAGQKTEHIYDWLRHTDDTGEVGFFKYFSSVAEREEYFNFWQDFDDEEYGDDEIDAANLQRLTTALMGARSDLDRQRIERHQEAVIKRARAMLVTASAIEALESQLTHTLRHDTLADESAAYLASLTPDELTAFRQESQGEQLNAKVTAVPLEAVVDRLRKAA